MMKAIRSSTSALLFILPLATVAQPESGAVFPELVEFAESLRSCEAASATQPHPLMASFTIEHTVVGRTDDLCEYRQTMPGNMQMICAFDEAMLEAYGDELEQTASTGEMSGSTAALPVWMSSCELEMPDGQRTPLAGN